MAATFDLRPATKEPTPLLLGLVGPSGTGKTYSALRLATGIQRVTGGDIVVIDTEARRSCQYSDRFKFLHMPFGAPFGSANYLERIDYCVNRAGAKIIVIDSMSHEHEGPGGVLETHVLERQRLGGEKNNFTAWERAKAPRRRLINSILQMEAHFIFCFRAKKKLRIEKGEDPEQRGFMPITGEDFMYELTLKWLLMPGADGQPTLRPQYEDEKAMVKVPEHFRHIFPMNAPAPRLSEDIGEQLARWAVAPSASNRQAPDPAELAQRFRACTDAATFRVLERERTSAWSSLSQAARDELLPLAKATVERLRKAAEASAPTPAPPPVEEGSVALELPDASPRPPPVGAGPETSTTKGATP